MGGGGRMTHPCHSQDTGGRMNKFDEETEGAFVLIREIADYIEPME